MRVWNALGLTEECRFDSWFKPLVEQEFTARGARCIRRLMPRVSWGIASPADRCPSNAGSWGPASPSQILHSKQSTPMCLG